MIEKMCRSRILSPAESSDPCGCLRSGRCRPTRTTSGEPDRSWSTAQALELGAVDVVELTHSSSDAGRAPKLIRQTHPRLCSVVFARRGALRVVQADRETVLDAGDFALCDSSRPFRIGNAGRTCATMVRAQAPRSVLPLSARQIGRLLVTRVSGQEGTGALFTQFLSGVTDDPASYRPDDVVRLSTVGLDLLAMALASHLDAPAPEPPEGSRHLTLLLSVEAFIREHLHDPDLSTRAVAAAHHISVSHLHRVFRTRGTTVAALIRRERLEGARRDLTDPRARDVPVHRIAARWGFKGHAAFTRTFRAAYGVTPGDCRRQALGLSI
ncbi:helix-turn-helix domain-containing protein [Streptomyces sp. NPDC001100]